MFYVDWADLERRVDRQSARSMGDAAAPRAGRRRRVLRSVDEQVGDLRRDVQASARTVLAWMAAVVDHEEGTNLEHVLDRCLRPGPDVRALNYAALAREIRETLNVDISPKRVRTAIAHLRQSRAEQPAPAPAPGLAALLEPLRRKLEANHEALRRNASADVEALRRPIAIEVLAAVRCAAGHLIENGYGEGIPDRLDLDRLQDTFLDFVRSAVSETGPDEQAACLPEDLHRLLVALCDFDGSLEAHARVVVSGSRVVADLMGPDSLPGLVAQLNVLVSGRHLLDTELYCAEMLRLGRAAAALHADPNTRRFMNWVRRLADDRRVPSPIRVSSYCFNNAATHVLERLFRRELGEADPWLNLARGCIDHMCRRDSGFRLIRTTQLIELTVRAELSGDAVPVEDHFRSLGPAASLTLLQDLARFDNCVDLVQAARHHAVTAIPELQHQLVPVG